MTIQEVHTEFKFRMDKFDSLNYPNFLPEEIDLILNQAQDRYVKQRYGITNPKRQSFEETQKRTEDLKQLVVNAVLAPAATAADNITTNAVFVTLPTDHWFIIQERCQISYDDCKEEPVLTYVKVKPIQHNEFDEAIINSFRKPDKTKVLRLMEDGRVELIHGDNITIISYRLRYLKEPVRVDINNNITFELSEHTHTEIIDEAVKIALEGIEAKRTPTFGPIDTTKE